MFSACLACCSAVTNEMCLDRNGIETDQSYNCKLDCVRTFVRIHSTPLLSLCPHAAAAEGSGILQTRWEAVPR